MRGAHREIEDALRKELLERVREATPAFFEGLLVNLLVALGYGGSVAAAGRALGKAGDGGVDGVIDQDALGLDRVYIQGKRYADGNNVGPGAIRDFFGSLDRFKANKGLFVTSSAFTSDARDTTELLSKRIVLIDGDTLTRLMVRFNVGCRPWRPDQPRASPRAGAPTPRPGTRPLTPNRAAPIMPLSKFVTVGYIYLTDDSLSHEGTSRTAGGSGG